MWRDGCAHCNSVASNSPKPCATKSSSSWANAGNERQAFPLLSPPNSLLSPISRTIHETPPHPILPSSGPALHRMLHKEEHGIDTSVASLRDTLQCLLQCRTGIYRRPYRTGQRTEGKLYGTPPHLRRGLRETAVAGKEQLRDGCHQMRKGHTAPQHQEETCHRCRQDKERRTETMAQPEGIQPLSEECLAADGKGTVPEGRLYRSGSHILIHYAFLCPRTRSGGRSTHLAGTLLCGNGLVLRCRGRHTPHGPRHHAAAPGHRTGTHHGRLAHTPRPS